VDEEREITFDGDAKYFCRRDPKENIHEQACNHTRHRSCSELEHCGNRSNLYHSLNTQGYAVSTATGASHAAGQAVTDACYETRQEAPSCSALWLPEGQEGCKTRACYKNGEDQSSILKSVFDSQMAPALWGHFCQHGFEGFFMKTTDEVVGSAKINIFMSYVKVLTRGRTELSSA
jgi:hypothetical protein